MYCTTVPATNATATEIRMPEMIVSDRELLMYSATSASDLPSASSVKAAAASAMPSNSNTIDTVVEVGRPSELKVSSRIMSVTITAKKITMISLKVNICGLKTPERAISIIPEEKVAPNITPMLATNIVVLNEAMRHPRAELRKLTASLLTPTNRSKTASRPKKTSKAM